MDARIPVSDDTRRFIKEQKPDGVTYDYFLMHAAKHAPPLGEN